MRPALSLRLRVVLVAFLFAVAVRADETPTPTPSPTSDDSPKSVSALMSANPRLTRWIAILKELKLWELLQESPPVTAFAPTNEALADVSKEKWAELKKTPENYRRFVLYLFMKGKHTSAQLHKGGHFSTLAGIDIDVKADGKSLLLTDGHSTAYVLKHVGKATNGFLYVIDHVLDPRPPSM